MSQTQVERLFIKDRTSLMFDQFRLNATLTSGGSYNATLTANLERIDTSGTNAILGTGMSESSGIFTFPATGLYLVSTSAAFSKLGEDSNYNGIRIEVTTDNSSYNIRAESYDYVPDVAGAYGSMDCSCLVDVTSTTNVKVRFNARTEANAYVYGSTSANATSFTFEKVGDT